MMWERARELVEDRGSKVMLGTRLVSIRRLRIGRWPAVTQSTGTPEVVDAGVADDGESARPRPSGGPLTI